MPTELGVGRVELRIETVGPFDGGAQLIGHRDLGHTSKVLERAGRRRAKIPEAQHVVLVIEVHDLRFAERDVELDQRTAARSAVGGLSTKPRRVVPGVTYLVTRRCSERRFFLHPDQQVTWNFEY